jgi:hypothetical protein
MSSDKEKRGSAARRTEGEGVPAGSRRDPRKEAVKRAERDAGARDTRSDARETGDSPSARRISGR